MRQQTPEVTRRRATSHIYRLVTSWSLCLTYEPLMDPLWIPYESLVHPFWFPVWTPYASLMNPLWVPCASLTHPLRIPLWIPYASLTHPLYIPYTSLMHPQTMVLIAVVRGLSKSQASGHRLWCEAWVAKKIREGSGSSSNSGRLHFLLGFELNQQPCAGKTTAANPRHYYPLLSATTLFHRLLSTHRPWQENT